MNWVRQVGVQESYSLTKSLKRSLKEINFIMNCALEKVA